MSNTDPKGYYARLCVRTDASPAAIKVAYRALAKELHPDRNQGSARATAEFQELQQAYDVLSDEHLRQEYDADSSIPASPTPRQEQPEPIEPILCSRCRSITAQPRFKVFYRVYGYFVGATKTPHQGVFCSTCEIKEALTCSAITLVAGWWSVAGFIWTCLTLLQKLVGGRFDQQNARLQAHQAMYFAQVGQLALARAVAMKALDSATRVSGKRRKNTGSDSLEDLKTFLTAFIEAFPQDTKRITLKSSSDVFNMRFVYQIVLIAAFASAIGGTIYGQQRIATETETRRLEQLGVERRKAAAVARSEAATLKALEQPLPPSGVMDATFGGETPLKAPFKVNNSPNSNTVMKLVREADGSTAMTIFIRTGEQVQVDVPLGRYRARIASGQTWYGSAVRFGPSTSYAVLDAVIIFTVEGDQLDGKEITLTQSVDGNLSQSSITANEF